MIYLIAGCSHAGKTVLSRKLIEKHHSSCLSIDHLKMGLIRSGQTSLTPEDDDKLTDYLWPILREMIKTAVENEQDLIIEGCYIPFSWKDDFPSEYLSHIRYLCLILSEDYIRTHMDVIRSHANDIERRLDDSVLNEAELIRENRQNLELCKKYDCPYFLIDREYRLPEDL